MSQPNPTLPEPVEPVVTTAIAEYRPIAAALRDLYARHQGVVHDCTTTKGMQACREARAEIRTCRTTLEAKRKEIKAPALERARLIDADAKRITEVLLAIEDPLNAQVKAEEAAIEERRKAEIERLATLARMVSKIRALPSELFGGSAAECRRAIEECANRPIGDMPEEIQEEASQANQEAMARLRLMLEVQEAADAEEARVAAERFEYERQQAAERQRQREERVRYELEREEEQQRQAEREQEQAEAERVLAAERERWERQAAEARAELDRQRAEQQLQAEEIARRLEELRARKEPAVPSLPQVAQEPQGPAPAPAPPQPEDDLIQVLETEYLELAAAGDRAPFDFALEDYDVANHWAQAILMMLMKEAGPGKEDPPIAQWARSARREFLSILAEHVAPAWARTEYERLRQATEEIVDSWP